MRILLVTNRLGVGGIEKNLLLLGEEFLRSGDTVSVAAAPGSLSRDLRGLGMSFVLLRGPGQGIRGIARDARAVSCVMETVDVVHVFSAWSNVIARLAKGTGLRRPQVRSTPILASMMGIVTKRGELPLKSWLRALLTGLGADALIAPSPAMYALARRLPLRPRRLETRSVVGVRTDTVSPSAAGAIRAELGIPDGAPLVVTVGRLDSTKSHNLFVDAAAALVRDGSTAHFLIVGDGDLRVQLQEQISRLGVGHRLHMCGERNDVSSLLAGTAVCVRPGVVEGFVGITVLEAQAQRTPVVAFDTEDVREAIANGKSGLLVRAGDIQALAAAIDRILGDPALAHRLGESGREWVERNFDIVKVAASIRDLYGELVEGRPGDTS